MKRVLFLLLFTAALIGLPALPSLAAEPSGRIVDLTPFFTKSQFDYIGTPWAVPKTALMVDGVPFRIDGIVELFGSGTARSGNAGPRTVENIPVGGTFAELHLLGATSWSDPDSTVIARVVLAYEDGTRAEVPIAYGLQVRDWFVPRREPAKPLTAAGAVEALRGECPESARFDKHYSFTRFILPNPHPTKAVRTIGFVSAEKQSSLMIAALSLSETAVEAKGVVQPGIAAELRPNNAARTGAVAALRGKILAETGEPLEGAQVRIIGVRNVGTEENDGFGEHPALGTTVLTGPDGTFEFAALTDDRLYRLAAAKRGFLPASYRGADPLGARPELRLTVPKETSEPSARFQVVDLAGQPVFGAMLRVNSVSLHGGTTYGGTSGFSSLSLTDTEGMAVMSRKDPFETVQAIIAAAGLAQVKARSASTGGVEKVTLGPGATLTGRILKDGQPVAGRVVGLVGADRSSEVFVGYFEEKTDAEGRFVFRHVPPSKSYRLLGELESFREIGLVAPQLVMARAHGQTNDLGDLAVTEGLTLSGRVVRSDGKPNHPTLQLHFAHDEAWKGFTTKPEPDGRFELKHLPSGHVYLHLAGQLANRYRLDLRNRSLTDYNSDGLEGQLTASKNDLLILFEDRPKGSDTFGRTMFSLPTGDASRDRPLFGAEDSGPKPIVLSGRVVDDATGEPLRNYRIVAGRALNNPMGGPRRGTGSPVKDLARTLFGEKERDPYRYVWMENRFVEATQAEWRIELVPLTAAPAIRIEAEGYDPFQSDPLPAGTNGMVVRLQKGAGLNGVVLGPDGRPITGVMLALCVYGEQLSVFPDTRLRLSNDQAGVTTNQADGSFTLKPRKGARKLIASSPAGWAELSESDLEAGMKVRLKPWAAVTGILVDAKQVPQPNVELSLNGDFAGALSSGDPFINLQARLVTDAQGRFLFTNVPPTFLHLNRLVPTGIGGGSWTHALQTYVEPTAGKTNDLGQLLRDSPPPKPLMDRMKEKIGL